MRYEAYRSQISRAAAATPGAREVSLAGGFYGVQIPLDGAYAILVLDLDAPDVPEWAVYSEDARGDRCCDENACVLGTVRPSEFPELQRRAARALLAHRCP